ANILRNSGVNKHTETIETNFRQHSANFFLIRPDMSARERINVDKWFAHLHRKRLRSARRASTLQRCLCCGQSRDGNSKRTATDVLEAEPVTEFYAVWFAAMFAANSQFDVWTGFAAEVASNFHQSSNTLLINCCEWI